MNIVKCIPIVTLLLLLAGKKTWGQTNHLTFNSVTLEPTIAYVNHKGKPRRMAILVFKQGKSFKSEKIRISFNGYSDSLSFNSDTSGIIEQEIPLPGPEILKTSQASISVETAGQVYIARCIVEPARKWTMYILPHSHVDIGYTNTQEKVLRLHEHNIDEAIELAKKTADYPEGAKYKWNTEAIWVVENYLNTASEQKKLRFWDAVKKGWINLDGAYGNINTSETDSRQLMMMFAKSQAFAKQHDIVINTMFQGDVPGASWGLAAQLAQTGINYFLSGPNAEDRIGQLAQWQDKPFYWVSPSGNQKLLFWQCQPYSIGYSLKGSKIPNFFTQEEPKPFYTGTPDKNFLNPYLFNYLADLERKNFAYDMSILTWAMSDNAPIDPELPEAVKAWNNHFDSPKLIITSTKGFFTAFEQKYKAKIPSFKGDYTEYWTDGPASAAAESGLNRRLSAKLKLVDALWAIQHKPAYPKEKILASWTDLLLFNEHTWGAYNSVSAPNDVKVQLEWAVKKGYTQSAKKSIDSLLKVILTPEATLVNTIDVYNTLSWLRSDIVYVPAYLSHAGDLVKDLSGHPLQSQRLNTGELAFLAHGVPQLGKSTFSINAGSAYTEENTSEQKNMLTALIKKEDISEGKIGVTANSINNGIYKLSLDVKTGDINELTNDRTHTTFINSIQGGFNQFLYLPGDSLEKLKTSELPKIKIEESGSLVMSLSVTAKAPGCKELKRTIKMIRGLDKVELTNLVYKQAVLTKESVHFSFPFAIATPQVRYSIPWGSITVEADQLPYANRNWYTVQRWIDISNASYGVTLSSLDAPLFEIGKISTANLLGGLHHSPVWLDFTPQSAHLFSWVMNNLWHTNFKAEQQGPASFSYIIHPHDSKFDAYQANQRGLEDEQPLIVSIGSSMKKYSLNLALSGKNVYLEELKPTDDGKGILASIVSCDSLVSMVSILKPGSTLKTWKSDLSENHLSPLNMVFPLAAKEIMILRIDY